MSNIESEFGKIIKGAIKRERGTQPYDTTAKVVRTEGNTAWVHIDNGVSETPVRMTIDAHEGDTVQVRVSGGSAWLVGNETNPPTDDSTANYAVNIANDVQKNVIEVQNFVVEEFEAEKAVIHDLEADTAKIHDLTADQLTATVGYIDDLTADNITASDLAADHATVGDLDANYAHISNGVIDNAKIGYADVDQLDAHYAHINNGVIDNATIDYAKVNDLNANYASIDLANVNNAWIENGVIKDAAIGDAQIIGVSANKLTAGTIDAGTVRVINLEAKNLKIESADGYVYIGDKKTPTKEFIDSLTDELNERIDGAIETWTGSVVPTLGNAPAVDWKDDETKATHVGDVYYVINSASSADGYCYRFARTGSNTFEWVLIKDSDVTKALQELIDVQGDISGIKTFDTQVASWKTDTDEELSSLKGRTTTLETDMGTKVDNTTFSEVKSTVDSNSASITSLTTTVEGKADNSTVTSLTNRVSTVEQTATGLTSTVGELREEFDGLQVGGRNLVRDTATYNTDTWARYGTTSAISVDGNELVMSDSGNTTLMYTRAEGAMTIPSSDIIDTGETIQISIEVMSPDWSAVNEPTTGRSGLQAIAMQLNTANGSPKGSTLAYYFVRFSTTSVWREVPTTPANGEWIKFISKPITLRFADSPNLQDVSKGLGEYMRIGPQLRSNGTVRFRNLKFEIGNKATDWTPAPEDVDVRLTSAETKIDQNAEAITLRATKTEAQAYASDAETNAKNDTTNKLKSYSTTTQMNAAISESAEAISLSVEKSISNIQVGGRNLMSNTATAGTFTTAANQNWFEPTLYYALTPFGGEEIANTKNTQVAFSFDYSISGVDTAFSLTASLRTKAQSGTYGASVKVADIPTGSSTGHALGVRIITDDMRTNAAGGGIMFSGSGNANADAVLIVTNLKVEFGNKVTDWTPAPEDVEDYVDSSIKAAKLEIDADGIRAEVSKMQAVRYLESSNTGGKTFKILVGYATEGTSTTFAVTSVGDTKVGDLIYLKCLDNTNNRYLYIKGTVTAIPSTTKVTITAHGYEDILPVESIKSTINQSAESVKIQAKHVDIEGATIFSSGRLSTASLDDAYAVQIGGRNLLRKSYLRSSGTVDGITFSRSTDGYGVVISGTATAAIDQYVADLQSITTTNATVTISSNYVFSNGSTFVVTTGKDGAWYKQYGPITYYSATERRLTITLEDGETLRYLRVIMPSGATVNTTFRFKIELGNKQTDWTPAPEDVAAEEQYIYISKASGTTSVSGTTTWVTNTSGSQNTWTTTRPKYNSSYPVLFVAKQSRSATGAVSCTTPVTDETTTVIDGGHITTGTIDTNRLNAATIKSDIVQTTELNAGKITSGTLSADRIASGSLTIGKMNSDAQNSILNSKIEIGGTNFLSESHITSTSSTASGITVTYQGEGYWLLKGTATNTSSALLPLYGTNLGTSKIAGSGTFTLTMESSSSWVNTSSCYIQVGCHSDSETGTTMSRSFTLTVSNGSTTFTVPSGEHISRVRPILNASANGKTINTKIRLKLESGNKSTDWSPAPEDLYSDISSAKAHFGICATAASTAAKTVTIDGFQLYDGAMVALRFTNGNSVTTTATLNVNSTGAKTIIYGGSSTVIPAISTYAVVSFIYDATSGYWRMIDDYAGKTATTYITAVDNNGIKVHAANNPTTNYSLINASGMTVYKGGTDVATFGDTCRIGIASSGHTTVKSDGMHIWTGAESTATNEVAFFGATARIGKPSGASRQELDYHSLQLIDKEGNTYFYVSDLRDASGVATISTTFIGDGSTTSFDLQPQADNTNYTTTVDGTTITSGISKYTTSVSFSTAPSKGSKIVVQYASSSSNAKAYTFGTRSNDNNLGPFSIAEGHDVIASGSASHAEGRATSAVGNISHAEGYQTIANGRRSHAEGYKTTASGESAHAEGDRTTASGAYAHAEGAFTTASYSGAHAEGAWTVASGEFSHAAGWYTIADQTSQTAVGQYNTSGDTNCLFVVGKGDRSSRSNAFSVYKNGNATLAGSLTQNSDRKLKKISEGSIPDTTGIKAVRFRWKESANRDDAEHIGYIAQDVEEILPMLVETDAEGHKTLDYIGFLCAKIDNLERIVQEMKC